MIREAVHMLDMDKKSFPVTLATYHRPDQSLSRSDFLYGVSTQMADFLKIIPFILGEGQDRSKFSKRFYEYVSSQAELAETLLDSCGAKENRAWFFLREVVAAIRSVSKVCYVMRYLELRVGSYEILDQETSEFQMITGKVRQIFDSILQRAFDQLKIEATGLGLSIPEQGLNIRDFPYFRIPGRLYADMWIENSSKEDEAIVKIATSYLEIAEEYTSLGFSRVFSPQELVEMVPEHVNEERLRTFEAEVHNLQSVYDTYIQYTRMEASDPRLTKLRGCVSIALHLLEIATVLIHFHERHERSSRLADIYQRLQEITGTYHILDVMGNYALFYCTKFLQKGKQLSEEAVMDYAQITSKRIPIPIYRGFHVRPSTYIAKIARHYGAEIQMHLEDEVYDASCVFDLFRANEKINMEKRRLIAKKLLSAQHITPTASNALSQVMRRELKYLIDEKLLIVHQEILPEDLNIADVEKDLLTAEEVRSLINALITRLLALGKIDITMPLAVTFVGDRRPLRDIEVLAKSGYGEDEKGNNVPLPEEISYLYK
ncbi:hypothetical protein GF339_05785 [candidate division KSB3 bacterium]|uniref:HPr domain-containing protein n=1 Tax=candidate division KSB3 bacterium TaxID=2044937 RepID=A0A9D5Q504_9BACT|nr:hypothetical protein [candidate division KSB3 bacterium]MBD3324075.1 hypothetical protein [candidate division KSB3 bacterium]